MGKRWNDDHYTKRAKKEDFLARSVYKLEEIGRREPIFKGVKRVLDLGAAPGSWSQFVLSKCPQATVFAIDLKPVGFTHPKLHALQGDLKLKDLSPWLGEEPMDLVISDMAPATSGVAFADAFESAELVRLALDKAKQYLRPGGNFVSKIFMGSEFEPIRNEAKPWFKKIRTLRPDSVRKQSKEVFLVGLEFKGA